MIWSAEAGDEAAPLIVMVHGAMDRSAGLLKLSRQLDGQFRVLRYDRRGYGRSKPHAGPFDMDHQLRDLIGLIAGRPAVVFGHSYGGNVALAAAAHHPDLVRAVAVFETPLSWLAWWPGIWSRLVSESDRSSVADAAGDAAERFMVRSVGLTRWEMLPARVRDERRSEGLALMSETADIARHEPWQAADIHVPVVVMYGGLSTEHHRDGSHYLAELLSDRGAIGIEGARHNGPFTHPEPVADALRELTSRVRPSEPRCGGGGGGGVGGPE